MTLSAQTFPTERGTYVMMLRIRHDRQLIIGKLGRIEFELGWYAYVGSAFGPGGLSARLKRHCRVDKKSHWHVDYLRGEAQLVGVWTASDARHMEHRWAGRLMAHPFNGRPTPGFGCTDCQCQSHLIYFRRFPSREKVCDVLQAQWTRISEFDG